MELWQNTRIFDSVLTLVFPKYIADDIVRVHWCYIGTYPLLYMSRNSFFVVVSIDVRFVILPRRVFVVSRVYRLCIFLSGSVNYLLFRLWYAVSVLWGELENLVIWIICQASPLVILKLDNLLLEHLSWDRRSSFVPTASRLWWA